MHSQQKGASKVLFLFFLTFWLWRDFDIFGAPGTDPAAEISCFGPLGSRGKWNEGNEGAFEIDFRVWEGGQSRVCPTGDGGRKRFLWACIVHKNIFPQVAQQRGTCALWRRLCVCLEGVAEDSGHLTAAPSWDFPMAPITKQKAT